MMLRILFVLLICSSVLHAQELFKTDWEQGYVKDGKKYSVWQYFNADKEPELVINHSTGKVMFLSKDTSEYVINKNGEWVNSRLDIHPMPIEGSYNFYKVLRDSIKYPSKNWKIKSEGKVVVLFEIDTLGAMRNCIVAKGIGGEYDSEALNSLKKAQQNWIPARLGGKKYATRFSIVCDFKLDGAPPDLKAKKTPYYGSKLLRGIIVTRNKGVWFSDEEPAEFVGGQEGLAKWLSKNLKYPPSASRMGLEGKVYVKFIIEPDGSITNAEVLKGFDAACDQEALRVVSIMPKWKPGKQSGRAVRSYFTQVVYFRLEQ